MKYLFPLMFLIGSCSTPLSKEIIKTDVADKNDVDTNTLFENFIDTSVSNFDTGYTFSKIKIVDTINVYVKLKIDVFSLDSVVAVVTLINNEKNETFSLYKPILPDKYLLENTFPVHDSAGNILKFNAPKSNHQYILGMQNFMPAIIPDIKDENFLELKPGEELVYKINLANYFYFKGVVKKGESHVFVRYSNLMPYVKDLKHLEFENLEIGRRLPIYYVIESRDENSEYGRLKVFLREK